MKDFVSQDFIDKCNNAKTPEEFNIICERLYVYSSSVDCGSSYENCPVKDKDWGVFDACKQAEDRLNMGHCHSAFIATKLAIPRIKKVWNSVKGNTHLREIDDFIQDIFVHFSTTAIDKIDYSKGNAFNYLYDEVRTVAQTTGAPDNISPHMKKAHPELAVSTWSEIVNHKKGNSENEVEFDMVDPDADTSYSAIRNLELSDRSDYVDVVLGNDMMSKKAIQNELIGTQLFGGLDNDHDLLDRIRDIREDRSSRSR